MQEAQGIPNKIKYTYMHTHILRHIAVKLLKTKDKSNMLKQLENTQNSSSNNCELLFRNYGGQMTVEQHAGIKRKENVKSEFSN